MAKNYGLEYPERPLMAVISDLLGIEHFTTSNGGTVRSDFLEAVLLELGGDPGGFTKDGLIKACVEAATRESFDEGLWSPGSTVTNEALQAMIDGITAHGVHGRLEPGFPAIQLLEGLEHAVFDPGDIRDARDRIVAERAARDGQSRFRTAVLEAYGRKCAITGSDAVGALEAAHVTPYRGEATNVVQNGMCLRADLHRLWDGGQVAINEETQAILLDPVLNSTVYADLAGRRASRPRQSIDWPSPLALRAHRRWCDLG